MEIWKGWSFDIVGEVEDILEMKVGASTRLEVEHGGHVAECAGQDVVTYKAVGHGGAP